VWLGDGVLDFGFAGSEYLEELHWSPERLTTVSQVDNLTLHTNWTAQESTGVGGTNYIDLLFGAKFALAERCALGGSVSVPITSDGVRPAATGTLAFEWYF